MKKTINKVKYLLVALAIVSGFNIAFLASSAFAGPFDATKEEACAGVQLDSGGGCDPGAQGRLGQTIEDGINLVSVVVGIMAVVMIIIGGMRFVLSDGDSGKVTSARNTIIYALVGLILVAFAQIIVKFVLNRV